MPDELYPLAEHLPLTPYFRNFKDIEITFLIKNTIQENIDKIG